MPREREWHLNAKPRLTGRKSKFTIFAKCPLATKVLEGLCEFKSILKFMKATFLSHTELADKIKLITSASDKIQFGLVWSDFVLRPFNIFLGHFGCGQLP